LHYLDQAEHVAHKPFQSVEGSRRVKAPETHFLAAVLAISLDKSGANKSDHQCIQAIASGQAVPPAP
jgi:hypothetical protein